MCPNRQSMCQNAWVCEMSDCHTYPMPGIEFPEGVRPACVITSCLDCGEPIIMSQSVLERLAETGKIDLDEIEDDFDVDWTDDE